MTPEQRLDRAERIILMMAKAGHRARLECRVRSREQDEKINIITNAHMEASEILKGLALGQARLDAVQARLNADQASLNAGQTTLDKKMAELAESQKLTNEALQAFLNSQRKRGNDESSN